VRSWGDFKTALSSTLSSQRRVSSKGHGFTFDKGSLHRPSINFTSQNPFPSSGEESHDTRQNLSAVGGSGDAPMQDHRQSDSLPNKPYHSQQILDELTTFMKSWSDTKSRKTPQNVCTQNNAESDTSMAWFFNFDKNNLFTRDAKDTYDTAMPLFNVQISPSMSVKDLLKANEAQRGRFQPMDVEAQPDVQAPVDASDAVQLLRQNDLLMAINEQHEKANSQKGQSYLVHVCV